jgi:hypothetical protein
MLYAAVYMATKTNIKCKVLPVSEKLAIIMKVDAQPLVMCTEVVKQLCMPLSKLNNIIAN